MNGTEHTDLTGGEAGENMNERKLREKAFFTGLIPVVIMGVVLFGSAGRIDWPMAWVILGTLGGATILVSLTCHPDLISERLERQKGADALDARLVRILNITGFIPLIIAGLQVRFGWPNVPSLSLQVGATILFILGYGLFSWAMVTNRFFSLIVRIQSEKKHHVVRTGPYRYLRHPGYAGFILIVLSQPIMLGSFVAVIPALIPVLLFGVRAAHEDSVLTESLEGYAEYRREVRYRLIPGIW